MRGTKRKWIPIAVMLAAALIVYLVINFINRSSPVSVSSVDRIDTVVIDAGHGGIDGGATGIGGVVEKIALSHPEISFKFISDGEVKFMTSGSGELREAIWALFGKDTAARALKVDREENGIRIVGYKIGRAHV